MFRFYALCIKVVVQWLVSRKCVSTFGI